jgi:hypothetical protein
MSASVKTRKKEAVSTRLQRQIDLAQAQLERHTKEMEEDKAVAKAELEDRNRAMGERTRFDDHILE